MTYEKMKELFSIGETISVEFKRCGNGIEMDTYESVCSFLNRFGGDLFLGVLDNGTVKGIPPKAAPDYVKNFIRMISDPNILNPTVYLSPEILEYEGQTIIYVRIPPSSEVHTCKNVIYDRVDDSDVKVTATGQKAQMYIRKQKIYTEKQVYPYIKDENLRLDLLPRIRQMAVNRQQDHPWKTMSDSELLQSAGLISEDWENNTRGYNLAAVMLLGRDDLILNVCPAYRTDALLRKVNVDRYDDRVIVQTNLIESYGLLMQFAEKHLLDKFYLEGDARVSLRSVISREIIANTLMHREFTSSYYAQFVIERDRMYTTNANRAAVDGILKPEEFTPRSKNPIIASFFRNIWLADELGSGMRKLHHYVPRYSGSSPELTEGDVFKVIIPLDDEYSYEVGRNKAQIKAQDKAQLKRSEKSERTLTEATLIDYLRESPHATQVEMAEALGKSRRTIQEIIHNLKNSGTIKYEGSKKTGYWVVSDTITSE